MSNSISLSTIQATQITSLCKVCSNALVLVDTITFEWFRITNIIGHLFCSTNRPTIKRLNDSVNNFQKKKLIFFYVIIFLFLRIYLKIINIQI